MLFDPHDPDFLRDPYPTYDRLRAEGPIQFDEAAGMWFVFTYEDVTALLRDRRLGRQIDHVLSREARGLPPKNPAYAPFDALSEHSMFDKEPPDHTRLRSLVHKAFTPKRVENLRERVKQIAHDLLDEAAARGAMDVIADFATPLPVTVIAELLGIPEADRRLLRPWSQAIVALYELDHTPEQAERAICAAEEFAAYLRDLSRARRADPQDDLISALALVTDNGDRLTEAELISTCVLLLNAGHEATVNVIGNGLLALLTHPDQRQRLTAHPELLNSAVEEMMRYDTPLQLFRRWVLEDIAYKDKVFKQGTEIALLFGAANRDPAQFPDPHCFDIARAENDHIAFGMGIHYCLGAPLARLELQIAFDALLRRFPALHLTGSPPAYRPAYVIRGLQALNVNL
ncbi:MAG: cytochrome P450 [Aggregatilineales bacterium]